jgi:8-oxo-dGTP diphosphatase
MGSDGLLLVVAAALIDSENRVLLQQRPVGKSMAGLWEFPGGKVEPNEAHATALSRELFEELGITVAEADMSPLSFASEALGQHQLLLLLYGVHSWVGVPEPLHASALRWCDLDEMEILPMPPADVPLVSALKDYLSVAAAPDR